MGDPVGLKTPLDPIAPPQLHWPDGLTLNLNPVGGHQQNPHPRSTITSGSIVVLTCPLAADIDQFAVAVGSPPSADQPDSTSQLRPPLVHRTIELLQGLIQIVHQLSFLPRRRRQKRVDGLGQARLAGWWDDESGLTS